MKKHTITALAAALCLLYTGIPAAEIAASAVSGELTYEALTYKIEDGSITISGCDSTTETIRIPDKIDGLPVTKIGATAFYGSALTSVTIPEGVTDIASGAFWHSKNLVDVTLPSTLTTIESFAFNDCQALETISFPESVTSIGNSAFGDTAWLNAQKEQSPFVIVNNILIDASAVVSNELAIIEEEKERAAQEAAEAAIWKRAGILTNQIGYFPNLAKKATLLTDESAPVEFELLDENGVSVYSGTSTPLGFDEESGDTVQILDFSEFTTEGTFTLRSETGAESRAFHIGIIDTYSGLLYDSLNYFYQNRSGIEIEEQYITSGDAGELAREAGHTSDIAEIQHVWGYTASSGTQEVSGGWYDAGDHGKYVVNGGISLWLMQNQYERALLKGTAAAYQDGAMQIPENTNGLPDLLDEARYEMEWMLKMVVQDGDCKDMVYHKVHDAKWTALGLSPANDTQKRLLMPPSTAATLNLAACGAQAYRLWKDSDPDFAEKCLTAAKNAYQAAKSHPEMYAPFEEYGGGGAYGDDVVTDEFYWAACELYTSTGDSRYYSDLQNSSWAFAVPSALNGGEAVDITGSFDWGHTAALGSLTLTLHDELLTGQENTALKENLTRTADIYLQIETAQGYGLPYRGTPDEDGNSSYVWASNSFVSDNAIILAYAYDLNQNADYLNGAVSAVDYLLGRNPMDYSYVTGYGIHSAQYPHHRWWAKELSSSFPKAPCGVLVGGPNTGMEDTVVQKSELEKGTTPPQKFYIDDIEAYSVNECAINWNTSLAWITSYLCEQNGGILVGQPSGGSQIPEAPAPEENPEDTSVSIVVTVPEGVISIGEQIFGKYNSYVTEVILPDDVKFIGKQAFYRCTQLEALTLPDTIELVGEKAFGETPWLTKMLADSPMLIMKGLLIDGTALEGDVVIPEGVTAILGNAFYMNKAITSVTIPEGVKTIGDSAFEGCESLTTVSFPESLETIGQKAFSDTGLTALTIPKNVKTISAEAFINCKSLTEVTIHSTNAVIGSEAFGCTSIFTASGQYSYIFVHQVIDDFVINCNLNSTAAAYAESLGIKTVYLSTAGDVNEDDTIDIRDVILLNRSIFGKVELSETAKKNADVDKNGIPDATDSLEIMKYIVRLISAFD